jgi:putative membrane protein
MSEVSLQRKAAKLEHSAGTLERSADNLADSADRRTELAADRTIFAAERTYAAWVRTGLIAFASGVGARKLLEDVVPAWMGTLNASLLILFSAFCFAAAVWRNLYPGPPPPVPDARRIHPGVLILVNGVLVIVSLTAWVGIMFGPAVIE